MTNKTYIDLSRLENQNLTITVDIEPTASGLKSGIVEVFTKFPWLIPMISISIFILAVMLLKKQRFFEMENVQIVLASSFVVFMLNIYALYAEYWTSLSMLGLFGVVMLISLIMAIKDR